MVGAYAAVRLVLPIAPDWAIRSIAISSIVTAVYAAGMAIVQKEARRFFCYVFLSYASLVLVGLETATPIGLTGSLTVWMSSALALAGFGLTLRSMEARIGRISLATYRGMYEHSPTLAVFFLLTGLASVGFPGAFGFIGSELLVSGVVTMYPYVGMAVVLAGALNGIAVVQAYFRLFTGVRHATSISLRIGGAEKVAVLVVTALIIGGGLFPQPTIASRYDAAVQIVRNRRDTGVRDGTGTRASGAVAVDDAAPAPPAEK
jgi:NADH-quinone oxidoreductase subunit M